MKALLLAAVLIPSVLLAESSPSFATNWVITGLSKGRDTEGKVTYTAFVRSKDMSTRLVLSSEKPNADGVSIASVEEIPTLAKAVVMIKKDEELVKMEFDQAKVSNSLAAATLRTQAPAQVPARVSQESVRRDNYLMTILTTDKDGDLPEICVVLAAPDSEVAQFNVTLGVPGDKIHGLLRIGDAGALTLDYTLVWETRVPNGNISKSFQIHESSIKSSVCLKLGEEVQILRVGTRTTRLSIKKLAATK